MTYKNFIVDVFNLAYRKKSKISDPKQTANNVINFITDELLPRLETDGTVYLAFDPLPKDDLGMEKNFKYSPDRQKIKRDYKSNRVHDETVIAALQLVKKYYTYRGPQFKIVISDCMEADDFVEGLVQIEKDGNIALISNDMDWARYIDDRVHMINKGFDEPYTKAKFFEEKGYFPTIAAITLDKAIFGDASDCIEPILTKKNKVYRDSTDFVKALIKEISKTDTTVQDIEDVINDTRAVQILEKEKKSHLEDIMAIISISNDAMESFRENIRVIKCRCDDVTKYIRCKKPNDSFNKLLESTLGRNTDNKQKFRFGNIS